MWATKLRGALGAGAEPASLGSLPVRHRLFQTTGPQFPPLAAPSGRCRDQPAAQPSCPLSGGSARVVPCSRVSPPFTRNLVMTPHATGTGWAGWLEWAPSPLEPHRKLSCGLHEKRHPLGYVLIPAGHTAPQRSSQPETPINGQRRDEVPIRG